MLKLIYKTLLVSVLSGALLLLNFSYNGLTLNSAYAESVKTEKIENKNLMGTLTMTVVGVLAKRLYKYKPTMDIMLAAAGGAIFIAGEVLAFFKLKEVVKGMEVQITRDKNGNVNKEQIESIERLKESYVQAKKTANMKKTLQMAAAAAFAAAGALAFKMTVKDLASLKSCNTGIMAGLKVASAVKPVCKGLASNPSTASQGAKCFAELAACTSAVNGYKSSVMSYELGRQATGPSLPGLKYVVATESTLTSTLSGLSSTCKQYTSGMAAPVRACQSLVPNNAQGESGGTGLVTPIANNNIFKNLPEIYKQEFLKQNISERLFTNAVDKNILDQNNLFLKVVDLFFPQAKAEIFSAMGIASKAAVGFLFKTSATIGPAIDTFMLIPKKRAIVWGTLSGLTAVATASTNKVIAEIDSNIEKIDAILKSMYSMADGATGSQINPIKISKEQISLVAKTGPQINAVSYKDVDLSKAVKGTLPCATGEEGQKCKSFEDSTKDLPSIEGLDSTTALQMSNIFKTASGLNGTSKISSAALDSASKLAGQTSAIKSSYDRARSQVSFKLKEDGLTDDLDSDTKKFSDQMDKAVRDGLTNSNMSASDMASNMSGAAGAGSTAVGNADQEAIDAEAAALLAKNMAAAEAAMAASSVNINSGSSDNPNVGMTNVDNGKNGEMSAEEIAAYNSAAKGSEINMDNYELAKQDISKNSESNLFELISNRYKQSGYRRLFKIKDPSTPETQELIKN